MDIVVPLRDPLTLAWIFRRRGEPRRPPQMVVGEEAITIEFDEPLVVPRSAVVLLFHSPVAGFPGILLAAVDPKQAEDALAPLRVSRPLTQDDVAAVDAHVRGRRSRRRRAALESGG